MSPVGALAMASKPKEAAKEADAEATTEEAPKAQQPPPKRKLPLKLILIAVGGLVVVGGGGFGAYKMFFGGHKEPPPAAAAVKPAVFVDLPEVLVNLSNTGSERTQYLKVKIVLELADQELMQQIQPVMPRLTDTFPDLSARTAADRPRRLRRALPSQGRAHPACQRADRAEQGQRRSVQGNRGPVTN